MAKIHKLVNKHPRIAFLSFSIALSIIVMLPYFVHGEYILGGIRFDGPFHLYRIKSLATAISHGDYLPTVGQDYLHGFGYGVFLFYPYLLLYPFALFYLFTNSMFYTNMLLLFIINFATSCTTYYAMRHIVASRKIAYLTTFFWLIANYRVDTLFMRADYAESIAAIFLPLLFAGLYNWQHDKSSWKIITIAMAGMVYTHILSTYIAGLISIVWMVFHYKLLRKKWFRKELAISIALVFGLSLFVVIPIVEQVQYQSLYFTRYGDLLRQPYGSFIKSLSLLFTDGQAVSTANPMSMGLTTMIGLLLGFIAYKDNRKYRFWLWTAFVIWLIVAITPVNRILLSWLLFSKLQFLWRTFIWGSFLSSIFLSEFVSKLKLQYLAVILLLIMAIFQVRSNGNVISKAHYCEPKIIHFDQNTGALRANRKYKKGKFARDGKWREKCPVGYRGINLSYKSEFEYISSNNIGGGAEYLPYKTDYSATYNLLKYTKAFSVKFDKYGIEHDTYTNGKNIKSLSISNNWHKLTANYTLKNNKTSGIVYLPKLLYKGYTVDDGTLLKSTYNGFIRVKVTHKSGTINLVYKKTIAYLASLFISISTGIIFAIYVLIQKHRRMIND